MPEGLMQVLPFILMIVVIYFLIIRPQSKKQKEHRDMINSLTKGDKVIMNGGLIGYVHKIYDEREISLEIADDIYVRVLRPMISSIVKDAKNSQESTVSKKSSVVNKSKK